MPGITIHNEQVLQNLECWDRVGRLNWESLASRRARHAEHTLRRIIVIVVVTVILQKTGLVQLHSQGLETWVHTQKNPVGFLGTPT